jgi:hypothetical protein
MDGGSRMASMATSLYKYSTRLTGRHRAFVAGVSEGAPIPLSANSSRLSVNGRSRSRGIRGGLNRPTDGGLLFSQWAETIVGGSDLV